MICKLDVPYFSQLDNCTDYHGAGSRQCNLTSHAMALAYLKPDFISSSIKKQYREPESYLGYFLNLWGDTTDHEAMSRCLKENFNIRSHWSYDLNKSEILTQLENQKPVPIGVAWRTSGHIVLVVGCDNRGLLVHDPYGIRRGDGYDVGADGSFDHYSWSLLEDVFWELGYESGWGRIFD